MSNVIKLGVCLDCKNERFKINDATGVYDADWNTTGWGGSNPITVSDVEVSTIKITAPSGSSYGPYDISDTIPSLDSTDYVYIDPTDILGEGDGETLSDGFWIFDWNVKGVYGNDDTPFNLRCVKKVFVTCSVECCVDRLNSDMDPTCGCSDNGTKKALNAHLTLVAAKAAACCGSETRAITLLTKLQDICNNNCKNC